MMEYSTGNLIADSLALSIAYAERLTEGIPAESFGSFARPGGQIVQSNHPAFVMGHLSLYAPSIMHDIGGDAIEVPEGFEGLFSKDAQCEDDPGHTIYPPMDMIVDAYLRGYRQVEQELRQTPDEILSKANPTPGRLGELFPTLGSMHAFYVGGHSMIHLGQLSAWRRMMGMSPA